MKYGKDGSILQDPKPDNGDRFIKEQQDYLDKCAIAAMQGQLASETEKAAIGMSIDKAHTDYLVRTSYDIAEAMLAERERRAKQ